MPIDREAALKKAEKLLRLGRLDGAIQEYVRLIDEQPRDWYAINALGDLYLRSGDADRAVAQFTRVADHLFAEGFLPRAAALYKKALKVRSKDDHTLSQLAAIATRQGLLLDAKTYLRQLAEIRRQRGDANGAAECAARQKALEEEEAPSPAPAHAAPPATPPAAADEPGSMFETARNQLLSGNELEGRALMMRVLTLEPVRVDDLTRLAVQFAAEGRIDSGFGCIDVASDAALLGGETERAVEALETFSASAVHIPTLVKLVELCVDLGFDERLWHAQERLADAYLDAGSGAEARVIAEDLLAQDPASDAHADRLRRALGLLGVPDSEAVLAELRQREEAVPPEAELDLVPPAELPVRESATVVMPASRPPAKEPAEIDLTAALAGIGPEQATASPLDPTTSYERAVGHVEAGELDEAIREFRTAAAVPRTRFKAAVDLGHLYIRRGDLASGAQWLERAADVPAPSQAEAFEVLYDLAGALERLGESARAMAILVDLDADAGGYRDVRDRLEHLARVQPGGPGR